MRLPKIHTTWFRFPKAYHASLEKAFDRTDAFTVLGGKGSGKSALCETIASKYPKIIDLYGSRDNEGLAWLRSPFKDNVLFIKGDSARIDCNCADVEDTAKVTLRKMEKYDVILSCSAFYSTVQEEWYSLSKLMDKLWHRDHWSEKWCLLIREASNLIYSRLSLGETQQIAKSYFIYVMREMRHCGFALALDTLRWKSIDIDFRSISDYTFIKAQGVEGLPSGLRFLYKYFNPFGVMRCPVYAFAVVSRFGPLGIGKSELPYWHKREGEHLLSEFDIRIDYGEIAYQGETGFGKVNDYEHVRIIKARATMKGDTGDPLGYESIGKEIGRSSKTIFTHCNDHNNMIHAVGECDRCSRVGSEYAKKLID